MARIERLDMGLGSRLDELEQKMFLLKIIYEKYFSGLERIEPVRERDEIRRMVREFTEDNIKNATQRFKFQGLKARFQIYELYWTRNLVMIERGVHPKMRFRADQKAAAKPSVVDLAAVEQARVLEERQQRMDAEERAYKVVYDKYIEARQKCGQSTALEFDGVREALRKQVRLIKSTYNVESVKFRVVIEEGKAKVKALPQGAAVPTATPPKS